MAVLDTEKRPILKTTQINGHSHGDVFDSSAC